MNENMKQIMLFKEICLKVAGDFNRGDVISDAGLHFLGEVESKIGFNKRMSNVLKDRRHPGYIEHELVQQLTPRVFQIASGYEDANDSDDMKNDPIMKIVGTS